MPLDHISFHVPSTALGPLTDFLCASLAHIGFQKLTEPFPGLVGLGTDRPDFWLCSMQGTPYYDLDAKTWETVLKSKHMAWPAKDVAEVKNFHDAAVKAGGKSNGEPGPRPMFGEKYYAAFVTDPVVGMNWELVCRTGEGC